MIVYGKQICNHLISHHAELIKEIYLSKAIDKKSFIALKRLNKPILKIDAKKAQSMAKGGNHQGWLCNILPYKYSTTNDIKSGKFIVALDGLTDVGNIGAIIRSAYALGVDGVIVGGLKHLSSEVVARTSSGAMFDIPIALEKSLANSLNQLRLSGFTIYGADTSGLCLEDVVFKNRRVLVMGNEGNGLSKKLKKLVDEMVTIRMSKPFDSLNVSVAAGIIMYRMGYDR